MTRYLGLIRSAESAESAESLTVTAHTALSAQLQEIENRLDPVILRALGLFEGRIVDSDAAKAEVEERVGKQFAAARERAALSKAWPRRGAWVRLVPVEDAGRQAYRLHTIRGERIAAGLFGSASFQNGTSVDGREAALAFARKHGWRVAQLPQEVAGE